LTYIIDAERERDITTIDIPHVFIRTLMVDEKDMAINNIHAVLVYILSEITPDAYRS
jgi:hypothetical protein